MLAMVLLTACGGQASNQASEASSSRLAASPTAGPNLTGAYGLLLTPFDPATPGKLQLIKPDGTVAASVSIAQPSLVPQACGEGAAAWTQPAVSASNSHVYFRDGDTKIRMLVPPSAAVDVTTVPGGPTTISGFSVSPDDQRIAVVVEELTGAGPSQAASISLRLYVENLRGGGSHADIYTTSFPAGKPAAMLWPMGWHDGRLVLAVWNACTFESLPYPNAWHVADATNATRLASIGDSNCVVSVWPSPAGVVCFAYAAPGQVRLYDWTGKQVASLVTDVDATEVSPSGDLLAVGSGGGIGDPSPATTMLKVDGSGVVNSPGHMACLWIDESHVLAPDAVIAYPSGAVTALPQAGQCAGRFPGGL
jgi:hypothetical protein